MYNKNCFCITNEQHFSISVPPSDPISERMSSAQVLFLVSTVVSLALFFFLNEEIYFAHLHDKSFGVTPLRRLRCCTTVSLLHSQDSRVLFSGFFSPSMPWQKKQTTVKTCLRRPFPTVCLIFVIIAMALAAGRDCWQTAALSVGDTAHTQSSISRKDRCGMSHRM